MPDAKISDNPEANAGPDTLRRLLSAERQRSQKMQELLKFARDAARSATGNLIALDAKITEAFKEVVSK